VAARSGYWRKRHAPRALVQLLRGRASGPGPIFVVGTGRSGTHWLGHILDSHPEIDALIEVQPMFGWVRDMVLDPATRTARWRPLIRRYRLEMLAVAPRLLADKSHPALWLADDLSRAFPGARFVGIERGPLATVSSMLRHPRVRAWAENWRDHPQPSPFFGTTADNLAEYERASLAARCAYRWVSHTRELDRLRTRMGHRACVLNHAKLCEQPAAHLSELQAFLRLAEPFPEPVVQPESLGRWRAELPTDAVGDVVAVVEGAGLADRLES